MIFIFPWATVWLLWSGVHAFLPVKAVLFLSHRTGDRSGQRLYVFRSPVCPKTWSWYLRHAFGESGRKYLLGLKEELFWFGGQLHLTRHVFVQNLEIYILIFPKSHTNVESDKMITFDNHKVKCQLFLPLFRAVPQGRISLWPFFTFGWMLRWCQRCSDLLCCQISHLWSILVLVEFICVL